eukprot:TRINITY_DN635_c0_g2_i1.p2 TRINITY_DN635_c0_g2~~TRINITY_DN635_c0_g2_i1.p2  ORF type:complete len:501 (+),score=127.62 TRINITY_DN635_c0_g2_i1:357-1859(+)
MAHKAAAVAACSEGSITEQLQCISNALASLQSALQPLPQPPIETWPGNDACVSCHFAAGLFVGAVEIVLLYVVISNVTRLIGLRREKLRKSAHDEEAPSKSKKDDDSLSLIQTPRSSVLCCVFSAIGVLLSAFGWLYWFGILSTFWNFISWIMMTGIFVLGPGFINTLRSSKSAARSAVLRRRVKLGGWVLGLICFIMFPNLERFPQQIYRRFNAAETVILPDDPLVLQLQQEFFQTVPPSVFYQMNFFQQMHSVDEFIKDVIIWKSDTSQYGLVGLLTTAHEVIERRAGDCQGQAVTTASLLLSMGYQAWVVETPFHWWTHAWNNVTGEYANLNYHGSAGTQGSVNPQPIDLVYTRPPVACTNCSWVDAHNTSPTLYIAPPPLAFMIAMTGAHIFVRSSLTLETVNWWQMLEFGVLLGVAIALYATYYQGDTFFTCRVLERALLASAICTGPVFSGMCFWASVYYPVTLMHLVATISFTFTYLSSNSFNKRIGSPILLA